VSILATEEEVLAIEGAGTVVLWRSDDRFLDATVYHRYDFTSRWSRCDPEDRDASLHDYSNADLWTIATKRPRKSVISLGDLDEKVVSLDELRALPRLSIIEADGDIYQLFAGEWWQMEASESGEPETWKPAEMWGWHSSRGDGITLRWNPSETESHRAGSTS
jgi:hypothetical protein